MATPFGHQVPKGPSQAQIKTDAALEAERVKFEDQKRKFIERVASYEMIATDQRSSEGSSFEVADWTKNYNAGLFIPPKFNPTFDPSKFGNQDLSSFAAPNLGLNDPTWKIPTNFQSSHNLMGAAWGSQMPWQHGWAGNVSDLGKGIGHAVWKAPSSVLRRIF